MFAENVEQEPHQELDWRQMSLVNFVLLLVKE